MVTSKLVNLELREVGGNGICWDLANGATREAWASSLQKQEARATLGQLIDGVIKDLGHVIYIRKVCKEGY